MNSSWHSLSAQAVFQALAVSRTGLTAGEAGIRLKKYGPNALPREKPYSKTRLFLSQFNSPLIFILLIACGISIYLEHYSDAIFIIIVLLINTSVGFYQENKANSSLQSLKSMVKVSARVIRGGNQKEIDSSEIVPGDIVLLRAGDKVPADIRLFETSGLKTDESNLTGEWVAISKSTEPLPKKIALADRTNMAYMGTIVEEGSASGITVGIGAETAIGDVVSLIKETKERKTPLQRKIASLSKLVGVFIISIVAIVIFLGYVNGKSFADIFVASLALAVSATPAGLLPAVTVILVLGMRRILKQNGLVRKLIANETLGSVTVICTDKTGTLTEGKMQVSHILTGTKELLSNNHDPITEVQSSSGLESHIIALKAAVFSNDAFIENPEDEFHEWIVRGRPTERALLVAGTHAGLSKRDLEKEYPRIGRMEFNSEAKYSASLNKNPDGSKTLYVIGAPEIISPLSENIHLDGKKGKLDSNSHKNLVSKLETLTKSGLRVVACAYREFPKSDDLDGPIKNYANKLTLVGYIALKDPLRTDAKDSINITKRAGIRTVIITGDHRLTAQSIADEIGIGSSTDETVEGNELDIISDEELSAKSKRISVYARVSPGHKLRIIRALQSNNEVVAMLGDGVNDAPALKAADVGVAVGSGTDVAKEVADIVLLDDNFKTIVKAIEQGRVIFQNIRKVFIYLVADDFSELFLFLAAMAAGLPLPLLAAQILWINLVEDGLPSVALTTEQETIGVMDEKPRDPKEPILNAPMKKWMTAIFFVTGLAAFLTFLFLWKSTGDLEKTRSMVFAMMCLDSLIFAFSVRSFKRSIFRKDIFSNRILMGAAAAGLAFLLGAIYLPPLQYILSTQPLAPADWLLISVVSAAEIILLEMFKKKFFSINPVAATL